MKVVRRGVLAGLALMVSVSLAVPVGAAAAAPTPRITVDVKLGVGHAPYRPVLVDEGETPDGEYYESAGDCTLSGREILFGAGVEDAQGCGGIEIDATLDGIDLPGSSADYWDGSAFGTVTRRYGCFDQATGHKRVTLVRTARQQINTGARDSVLFPGPEEQWLPTVWVSPLETVTCRPGEEPRQFSISLCHLVLTASRGSEMRKYPVAGTWYSTTTIS